MKDSGLKWVGQIPARWEVFPLYKFVRQVRRPNVGNREKNLLSLSYGTIKRKDMETAAGLVPESYAGYNIIDAGDIVLRLTDLQNDKRSIRVGRSSERGIVTSAYVTIRPSKECCSECLRYSVLGFDIAKGFYGIGSGVRQGLNYDEVKKLAFPFPPLPEQRAIAARLDAVTFRIVSASKKIAAEIARLDAYKKSFITEAVCRGLNPKAKMKDSGIPWVGQIPEGWEVVVLSSLVRQVKNRNSGLKEKNLLSLSYGKVVRKNIDRTSGLMPDNYEGYNIIAEGDIVLRLTDLQNDKKSIRVGLTTEKGIITSAYVTIRPNQFCIAEFLSSALLVFDIKKGFYGIGSGVRQGLTYDELKRLKLPLPPLPEQREIAAAITAKCAAVDAVVAKRKRQLDRLDALKRSLVYEYVTGKKMV